MTLFADPKVGSQIKSTLSSRAVEQDRLVLESTELMGNDEGCSRSMGVCERWQEQEIAP